MAKFYGALVGVPQQGSGFAGVSNFLKDGRDDIIMRDRIALTTANAVGDLISMGVFRSSALISPSAVLWNDALGAGVTLNIGDATYPAGLMAAASLTAAGSGTLWRTFVAAKMGFPLWQALGYAADPGGFIELLATLQGAAPSNAGSLAWQLIGLNR